MNHQFTEEELNKLDEEMQQNVMSDLARTFVKMWILGHDQRLLAHIREEVERLNKQPTLCGSCNLNGKLCKECYANRRANSALNEVLALLT